jgi:23S rRNA (adenine2503-C2)-methyltransferase
MNEKLHLTNLSPNELAEFVQEIGEPKYRAKQIFKNLHERRVRDFDEMTDLPKSLREKLNETATSSSLKVE